MQNALKASFVKKACSFGPLWSACLVIGLAAGTAEAQVDLSGNWQPIGPSPTGFYVQTVSNGPPPEAFMGVPLNADGRAAAATADSNEESEELNRQCQPFLVNYLLDAPFGMELRPVADPLNGNHILAWHIEGWAIRPELTIWIDGRAPPSPLALHTWGGFATGEWHGNTLAVKITHIKDGWLLRNDAPASDQETVSLFLSRVGDELAETFIVHDPVYLSAPYPRARTLRLTEASQTNSFGTVEDCLPDEVLPGISDGYHAARYLPGQNPLLDNASQNVMMQNYHIPPQVALGGAQEMYPEFRKALRNVYTVPPGYCKVDCCTGTGNGFDTACPIAEGAAPAVRRSSNRPRPP